MTDLLTEYARFVMEVAHTPELVIAGVQRIHRNVTWTIEPEVFLDGSMSLEATGYTTNKLRQLERNYYNPKSIERARSDLSWRIKQRKYGSGAFNFQGIQKKGTKQDWCIRAAVISYYPQLKGCYVQVFWRTAELLKRFRGDIVFLRDFIMPHFAEEFSEAPVLQFDFVFANATFHPMYTALLIGQLPDWKDHFERIKIDNPKMFHSMCYWNWRYFCDTSASIDSYSSAKQVRTIANRLTPPNRLKRFAAYTEAQILADISSYPQSVQRFYTTSTGA